MEDYFPSKKKISKEKPSRGALEPIAPICLSKKLDEVLNDPNLKISYKMPEYEAVKFVSEKLAGGMEVPSVDLVRVNYFEKQWFYRVDIHFLTTF